MKSVILGVTGSIAAYKGADICSSLAKNDIDVHVIMTQGATKFIQPLTFQSLTRNKVYTDIFQEKDPSEVKHISLSQKASCFVVAPATANVIAKLAHGIADDMLSAVALVSSNIPRIIAPAMNTKMYENPITQENLEKLKRHDFIIIEPKTSRLACGVVGKGALANVNEIVEKILNEVNA